MVKVKGKLNIFNKLFILIINSLKNEKVMYQFYFVSF